MFNDVGLDLVPLVLQLLHLRLIYTLLAGVLDELIEFKRRLGAYLLCKLSDSGSGALANHQLTDFLVADGDAQALVLVLKKLLVDHLVEYLLLTNSGVHLILIVVLLSLSCGFLYFT